MIGVRDADLLQSAELETSSNPSQLAPTHLGLSKALSAASCAAAEPEEHASTSWEAREQWSRRRRTPLRNAEWADPETSGISFLWLGHGSSLGMCLILLSSPDSSQGFNVAPWIRTVQESTALLPIPKGSSVMLNSSVMFKLSLPPISRTFFFYKADTIPFKP